MAFNKKSQSGLETVFSYGWVVIVILVMIGTMTSYIFNAKLCPPSFEMSNNLFRLTGQKFIGSDSEIPESRNLFYLILQNNLPYKVTITEVEITKNNEVCGTFKFLGGESQFNQNEKSSLIQGATTNPNCYQPVDSCYNFNTKLKYTKDGSNLEHIAHGMVGGTMEGLNDRWNLGGWLSTDYSGELVNVRNGEYINHCENNGLGESPPSPELLSPLAWGSTLTWSDPGVCNGLGQNGFDNWCINTIPALAKGWIHTDLYVDPIFSDHKLYLGGKGKYWDNTINDYKTDGICMNDNLYFYLNGILMYRGGTSGLMVGEPNKYDIGDEVIKNCEFCGDIDPTAWCIPSFELTTSGLNFGENNGVDILVEDYCTSGGMDALNFAMI